MEGDMADEKKIDRLIVERIKRRLREADQHERKNYIDNPDEFKIAREEHAAEVLDVNLNQSDKVEGSGSNDNDDSGFRNDNDDSGFNKGP